MCIRSGAISKPVHLLLSNVMLASYVCRAARSYQMLVHCVRISRLCQRATRCPSATLSPCSCTPPIFPAAPLGLQPTCGFTKLSLHQSRSSKACSRCSAAMATPLCAVCPGLPNRCLAAASTCEITCWRSAWYLMKAATEFASRT